MPVRTDIQPVDIQDFLRKRRLEDIMKVPELQDDSPEMPPVQSPQVQAPQAQVQSPLDANTQQSTQDLRKVIQGAPKIEDYHPSLLRKIGSVISGVGTGVATGDSKKAADTAHQFEYDPFSKKMGIYQEQVGRAKSLSDIDTSIREQQLKDASERAKAGHLTAQGEAEVARKGAEEARRLKEVQQTKILPPDYETAHRGKLEELETSHPDKYTVSVDHTTGHAIVMNTKTGETEVKKYADPADADKDLSGTLKELVAANRALSDPKSTPERKVSAQQFIKHFQESSQQKPPQVLMFPPNGGNAFVAKPGTQIPAGSQTAAGVNASNTETSTTRTMRESAPKVIALSDKLLAQIDNQVSSLGPAASRWSEFMAGKVGAPNSDFTKLRTDAALLQTLLMRMHVGARGGEKFMSHFKDLIDVAKQDPANLKAAIGEIKDYAHTIAAPHQGEAESTGSTAKIPRNANETDEQYFMRVARGGK